MFAAEIAFVGEVPYHKEGGVNREGATKTIVNEAGYDASYGSSGVGIS